MKPLKLFLIVAVFALVFVTPVQAVYKSYRLSKVASIFAMKPLKVECATPEEDETLQGAYGYTSKRLVDWVRLDAQLCRDAVDLTASPFHQALAISVMIHESYHQRANWSGRNNEGQVECKTIRHFVVGAQLLGRTREEAVALMPYALIAHYQLTEAAPNYRLKECAIPQWEE